MVRCEDFYKKWEEEPNFCEKDPETAARIEKYLDERRKIREIAANCLSEEELSPIGDMQISEGALRPLIRVKDRKVHDEVATQIVKLAKEKIDKGEKPVITGKEINRILGNKPDLKAICKVTGDDYEYTDYGLNIYQGCPHACTYCYAIRSRRTSDNTFSSKIEVTKKASPENLEYDLKNWQDERAIVSLCHLCDPYPAGRDTEPTRELLKLFQKYNHPVQVITKGRKSDASRDFDLYSPGSRFCVTLTFDNPKDSLKYEPNAVLPEERIAALKEAHDRKIITMVSLEPVIDPIQSLHLIDMTHEFVDHYGVGKLNHNEKEERKTDWRQYRADAEAKLKGYGYTESTGVGEGKTYYIKKTLQVAPEYVPPEQPVQVPEVHSEDTREAEFNSRADEAYKKLCDIRFFNYVHDLKFGIDQADHYFIIKEACERLLNNIASGTNPCPSCHSLKGPLPTYPDEGKNFNLLSKIKDEEEIDAICGTREEAIA